MISGGLDIHTWFDVKKEDIILQFKSISRDLKIKVKLFQKSGLYRGQLRTSGALSDGKGDPGRRL